RPRPIESQPRTRAPEDWTAGCGNCDRPSSTPRIAGIRSVPMWFLITYACAPASRAASMNAWSSCTVRKTMRGGRADSPSRAAAHPRHREVEEDQRGSQQGGCAERRRSGADRPDHIEFVGDESDDAIEDR